MPRLERNFKYAELEGRRFGRFGHKINMSCIVYHLGPWVIDTGPPNQWRQVRRFLKERQVERVLLTHHHEDHSGNARAIQQTFQAAIHSHPSSSKLIQGRYFLPYQHLVWGRPPHFKSQPLPQTLEAQGFVLQTLSTPGHSSDMACFLEPERGWLFCGDLYIAKRPRYARLDEDPVQEMETIKSLLDYDFDTLFCAHRGLVPHGKKALQGKLEYFQDIYQASRERFQRGQSVQQISHELLGPEGPLHWLTSGDFSKVHLVRCCVRDLVRV